MSAPAFKAKTSNRRLDAAYIAQRYEGKKCGDEWIMRCPCLGHKDQTPSCTINDKKGGGVVVHCFGGCPQKKVIDALKAAKLWPSQRNGGPQPIKIEATYDYTNEDGDLSYQVVRLSPKDFRQRQPDGHGGWIWNLDGVRRVLYRLPKVLQATVVFIPEGEKDCLTLEGLRLTATCNSGGAGKWKPEYSDWLKGKRAVIIPDNDEPGLRHAETVAQSVHAAGARWVKVVTLPGAKDVSEWIEAGGTREELIEMVKNAPNYQPPSEAREKPHVVPIAAAADLTKFAFTDAGNGERLIAQHGQNIRHCDPFGCWFWFDGARWQQDQSQRLIALAKDTIRATYTQAAEIADDDLRKKLVDHARRSEGRSRLEAMVALARSDAAVTPEQFDSDLWLFNVENGTIDLRSGKLRPHDRKDLITKLARVAYDPEAKCPRWKNFLGEVFAPHPDLIPFIQRAVGYSLTGDTREECFFLLSGTGRNGKGVFLRTNQAMQGDHAGTADFSTFIVRRDSGMRDDIANMRGRRFVVAQEAHEGATLAEGLIKWLTGGDRVRARRLYENSYEFDPTFKLWLATNHKPQVRGADPAIWSRIKLVPFDVSFEGREDKTLKQTLLAELPGILAWSVRGCLAWQKDGLQFPKSVVEATKEYRTDSDQVGRFLQECWVIDPDARTAAQVVYDCYKHWCESNGEKLVLTSTAFGLRARNCKGVVKETGKHGVKYHLRRVEPKPSTEGEGLGF